MRCTAKKRLRRRGRQRQRPAGPGEGQPARPARRPGRPLRRAGALRPARDGRPRPARSPGAPPRRGVRGGRPPRPGLAAVDRLRGAGHAPDLAQGHPRRAVGPGRGGRPLRPPGPARRRDLRAGGPGALGHREPRPPRARSHPARGRQPDPAQARRLRPVALVRARHPARRRGRQRERGGLRQRPQPRPSPRLRSSQIRELNSPENLTTQWHIRYGGRGVVIYWHVERKSLGIHSQLKSPSSSEVASMIQGVLRHCTELEVDRQYVDSHGQSVVAFAFTKLLGFQLLPRLKAIHSQRLYRPEAGKPDAYPNLQPVLSRPIDWELIRRQYDETVKYATALRLGTAEAEAILRRFTRENVQHPTYKALAELGKAVKTTFLCRYVHDQALRREINDGLNVVEHWNSANDFIFFARRGEFSSNRREDQELSMLSLHLLQNCMVYVNTLMVQQVLARPEWKGRLTPRDLHALTPLFWGHVNPYGRFDLDMRTRLDLN